MIRSKNRYILPLLLAIAAGRVLSHEGHDHSKEANLQVLKAGPNQLFQVSVAHLPDAPVAGQPVKFLARLEETTASDDPLLGGRAPVVPRVLEASLNQEGRPLASVKIEPAGEAGIYRFQHLFSKSGRWRLLLRFQNPQGIEGKAEFVIPVKAVSGAWTLPLLQGIILLGCLGLVVQRFFASGLRAALASSFLILLVGGGAFALVTTRWPSPIPPVTGDLSIEALEPAVEQAPELAAAASEKARPQELLYETPPAEPATVTGTVRYASNRVVAVSNPSPGTIVYKQGTPKLGDWVKTGQVLAVVQNRFNSHDAAHLLNQRWDFVKAQLRAKEEKVQAETAFQRATRLFELGTISGRQLQAAQFRLNAASSALKEADDRLKLHDSQIQETNLKQVEVTSPISGYISRAVYPASGQMFYGGDTLFEIVDPAVVWVEAYAFPQDLQQVQAERVVMLRSNVFPDRTFQGKLLEIRSDTEPVSKTIRVLYEVQNPDRWLRAGMLLSVSFGGGGAEKQPRGEKQAESRLVRPPLGGE